MAGLEFSVPVAAAACSTTAKSMIGVKAPANHCVKVHAIWIGFDSVTSTYGPILIEIGNCTFASNGPGTNSTSVTPYTTNGRTETIQSTAGKLWTVEPTVITVPRAWTFPTYMGAGLIQLPLSRPILIPGGAGLVLRMTLPAATAANFTGSLDCEE